MDTTTSSDWISSAYGTGSIIAAIAVYVLFVVALWRIFTKAGRPGWWSIIPILNTFVLVSIAGYNAWLTLLYLIPIVNIVFSILVAVGLGRAFGKGGAFSFFLLWLFAAIGYLILGFGEARYRDGTPTYA